ncbi:MAG: recombinase family protein [Cyanobacteriota bacterium]|nr:recombinase family protein [Cyanobacteriota bacterium]
MTVGGYIRVSSRRQRDESDSPASQRQRLKDAGCTVFYEDLAVSGYRLPQRRKAMQFQRMWQAIESGQLTRLIATRLDRYARRDQIVLELAQHCEQHDVEFVSLSSGVVDTSTASGWLNVKVQLMFAEHYSRQLSENVKQGYAGLHRQGIPACSSKSIPWHLQRDPDNRHGVIKGPGWADARYVIERLLKDDWSLSRASNYLYPRYGVMGSHTCVREWIRRPSLVGHLVRNAGKPDEMVMRNCWPALATELEQLQVLRNIQQHKRARRSVGKGRHLRPLSGFCVCGACGANLRIHGRSKGGVFQGQFLRCGAHRSVCSAPMIRVEKVETQLLALLGPRLKRLVDAAAVGQSVAQPPAEVADWRRELLARESIPVEYRQLADQTRIAELQGLIESAVHSQAAGVDQAELLRMRLAVESEAEWLLRPDEDRNRDLRQLIDRAVVNTAEERITEVHWRLSA